MKNVEERRLCYLIDQALSPYLDSTSLSKQIERNLLISLSQVFIRIKHCIKEYDISGSQQDAPTIPMHSDDHCCLTRIITHLITLLAFENPFIQHLTGNILVAIYELLVAYDGDWEKYISFISLLTTYAIHNTLEPIQLQDNNTEFHLSVQNILLKMKKTAAFFSPAALTRVMRNIMKILKQDFDYKIYHVYICSTMKMISRIPWHLLKDVSAIQSDESAGSHSVFKGNLLQFFCSLVDNTDEMESGAVASKRNHLLVSAVSNLLPDLLSWCLGEQERYGNIALIHYFRHKLLMLIKSTSQINLDFDSISARLHLLWKYFPGSLAQKIHCPLSDLVDCLEDSPFTLYDCDGKGDQVLPNHLQRLTIFLLFRFSFSLIRLEGTTSDPCACADPKTWLIPDFNASPNCCSRRKGLLELHRWLQGKLHPKLFEDSDMYSTRCINFATSFLRLFIHEDDILFKMLLQLFEVPVYPDRCITEEEAYLTPKTNMFFLVSDIFNPINIFHLFLAEIHYDHQVLLDYLISKDSGPSSAEYLLRCLRVICTSWWVFEEFPRIKETPSNNKRRKLLTACVDFEGSSSTSLVNHSGFSSWNSTKCKKGDVSEKCIRLSFEDAKACLFSLETSIGNLREKDIFPYNPQVLLNRCKVITNCTIMLQFEKVPGALLDFLGHTITVLVTKCPDDVRDELTDVARTDFVMPETNFLGL